jgi:hypothetical protein
MGEYALDAGQVKNLAIGATVVIVVIGLILGLLISALIGRLVVLVVVVVLGALLWTQRAEVEKRVKDCNSNVSFFGYHVSLSPSDEQKCHQVVSRSGSDRGAGPATSGRRPAPATARRPR